MTIRLDWRSALFILAGCIIAIGLAPVPKDLFATIQEGEQSPTHFRLLALFLLLSSLVPIVLSFIRATTGARIRSRTSIVLAILVLFFGGILTAISAAFSGGGANLVLLQGVILTIAVAGSLILLSREPVHFLAKTMAIAGLCAAVAASLWSLIAAVSVVIQTNSIAESDAFCLAHHQRNGSPIDALAELRGFKFYTTRSGYKSTSRWYFHGVLIVETPEGRQHFNWSPKFLRFDPIKNEQRLLVPVRNACVPREDFWNTVTTF